MPNNRRRQNQVEVPTWFNDIQIPEHCVSKKSSVGNQRIFRFECKSGDEAWCIEVDGGWIKTGDPQRRVDYMFLVKSRQGRKAILLVELKGKDYYHALEQVEATLSRLCRRADGGGIHNGSYQNAPGHDRSNRGGVRAYVVTSNGRNIPRCKDKELYLWQKFGVGVFRQSMLIEAESIDELLDKNFR